MVNYDICTKVRTHQTAAKRSPVGTAGEGLHDFFAKVVAHVGPEYELVGNKRTTLENLSGDGAGRVKATLYQMRLIILAKIDISQNITAIGVNTEATGIGGIIANKGGIVAKFDYRGDSIAIVCTHLAAHEGKKHREARNDMARQVQKSARVGEEQLDIGSQFEHIIWAGDLNYRCNFNTGPYKADMEHEQKLLEARKLVTAWAQTGDVPTQLFEQDELHGEVAEGRVFAGFTDALTECIQRGHNEATAGSKWTLPPTFKMKRHVPLEYNPQRVPSFTDRILYRSMPGREACIKLVNMKAETRASTSDHKPVYASFDISVPRGYKVRNGATRRENEAVERYSDRQVVFCFTKLEAVGLAKEGMKMEKTVNLTVFDKRLLGGATESQRTISLHQR